MAKLVRLFIVVLAFTLAACGASPTRSTPIPDTPATPTPQPIINSVKVESITTTGGSTIESGGTVYMPDTITFRIRYTTATSIAEADLAIGVEVFPDVGFPNLPGKWLKDVLIEPGLRDIVFQVEKSPSIQSNKTTKLHVFGGPRNSGSTPLNETRDFPLTWLMKGQ